MGRTKVGIGVAGAVVALLGVVAAVTMRSDGSSDASKVVSQGPVTTVAAAPVASTAAPAGTPATAASAPTTAARPSGTAGTKSASPTTAPAKTGMPTVPVAPSVQDIQQLIAGITAQITAPSASPGTTAPLTAEQIEARVREELRTKYGITL